MKRREFIKLSALGSIATGMMPTTLLASRCDLTSADILGPFWDENHPYRTLLAHADEPGTRIFISGTVTTDDCEIPIQDAIVDVWHANDVGCYTVFQECDTGNPDDDPYNLTGQMITNENGEYAFESIWPGYYGGRPKHFHYKITTPAGLEHVTQCYFEGDSQIDEDWEEQHAGRIIPLEESENGLIGVFDIAMDEEGTETGLGDPHTPIPAKPFLNNNYPNPFNNSTQIEFGISKVGYVNLTIYDVSGKWVTNLVDKRLSPGAHRFSWNGTDIFGKNVPSGSYLVVMKSGGFTSSKKIMLLK
ncbi:MAG: T9SS type A sorting domain-containing protein [Candidatus Marinimicrobia bacterium]|nr:T9SS type A sorting domain-containing protein [Candidatus Neomarinimicrobiota bacterium]